jgi:hypothetical protein
MASAISTYLAAMNTAVLEPIIWHRPAKGTFTGGAVGLVVTGAVSQTPASLRTRRTLCCGAWYSAEFTAAHPPGRGPWPIRCRRTLWISVRTLSTGGRTTRERTSTFSDVLLHSGILANGQRPGGQAGVSARGLAPLLSYASGPARPLCG